MTLVYVGDATFVDKEPVDLAEVAPREWSPRNAPKVYWYVRFFSLERAGYGFALLAKGPKSKWIDHEEIREQMFDPTTIAPLSNFSEGLESLERGRTWAIEEFPFVEVKSKEDYDKALQAFIESRREESGPREWSPRPGESLEKLMEDRSDWRGPGVYDFRDMSLHEKSVEKYEVDGMEYWAKDTLDSAYDDEWQPALKKLLERNL